MLQLTKTFIQVSCKSAFHSLRNSSATLNLPVPVLISSFPRSCCDSTNKYLKVQQPAPDFSGKAVINSEFKDIKLSDFAGKYLVLFFYPLDFTFVCPTEIVAFSDKISEFQAINTNIVGCSCDSHFTHLAWINTPRNKGGLGVLRYPLLSDFRKNIAKSYNVLLEKEGIPLRGLFIIDPKGILRQIIVNDLPVGRSVDEVLRLVKAIQFVDKHGEVCPANWQPDSPTIKPTPEASQEYFHKVNK